MKTRTDYHLDRLHCLVGGKITALARTGVPASEFEDEYFGLVVTLPNGTAKTLIFLSDDEGNGPGSFEMQTRG